MSKTKYASAHEIITVMYRHSVKTYRSPTYVYPHFITENGQWENQPERPEYPTSPNFDEIYFSPAYREADAISWFCEWPVLSRKIFNRLKSRKWIEWQETHYGLSTEGQRHAKFYLFHRISINTYRRSYPRNRHGQRMTIWTRRRKLKARFTERLNRWGDKEIERFSPTPLTSEEKALFLSEEYDDRQRGLTLYCQRNKLIVAPRDLSRAADQVSLSSRQAVQFKPRKGWKRKVDKRNPPKYDDWKQEINDYERN